MQSKINQFFESLQNKKVAFIGIGESHIPLLKMFKQKGVHVIACDRRSAKDVFSQRNDLKSLDIEFRLGENYLDDLDADVIFRTPGMKFYTKELQLFRKNEIVVTSEMEVFFDLCPCKIIAVTGSDGKTTTTTIISKILELQGKTVHIGGNIGVPLLPKIESINCDDIAVVELSSFQLISMRTSPDIAVVTNLSENHLDVHKDMSEYVDAKKNIVIHQNAFSRAVLNYDNELTRNLEPLCRGQVMFFSREREVYNGSFMDSHGDIFFVKNGCKTFVMNKDQIKIRGMHNVENYLAAICAVYGCASFEKIVKVANGFNGVSHRIEFVREIDGVCFYNDSIASSPTRVIRGTLSLFNKKIVLICGGYDKKIPFDELGKVIPEKVKTLILLGQTSEKIKNAVVKSKNYKKGSPEIIKVGSMKEAVYTARGKSVQGDKVFLSPACASFDMYKNFEARGNDYKNIVRDI